MWPAALNRWHETWPDWTNERLAEAVGCPVETAEQWRDESDK